MYCRTEGDPLYLNLLDLEVLMCKGPHVILLGPNSDEVRIPQTQPEFQPHLYEKIQSYIDPQVYNLLKNCLCVLMVFPSPWNSNLKS